MTPVELSRTVLRAVRRAVDEGQLSVAVPERAVVTTPGPGGCGDYATNIALQLARPAGQPPLRVAEILRPHLAGADGVGEVAVTGPGFLNISLRPAASAHLVEEILRQGTRYGFVVGSTDRYGDSGDSGARVARPSPSVVRLHCPLEVRAVVVMDVVARMLRAQGVVVRASCDAPLPPEWEAVLGVHVDADGGDGGDGEDGEGGRVETQAVFRDSGDTDNANDADSTGRAALLRPVPAPADPLALGRDAARWALLYSALHDRPRIGDEHLVQRESNPLFRVRYAHARTRALGRNAADLGFHARPGAVSGAEALLGCLADHPRVLARAAAHRAPDRLARHLVAVADAVLPLLAGVLPRGEEKPSAAHRARLALAEAAGTVLAGGLSLLGIDAPDHL
ncbi:ArgS-related anticodon-binding protein NrtL [Streptomyces sp. NPDC046831]|uniref:ArgS-related anticodon-binding protein NrtL n=1 Tax=Streptomyces sp. NPDC046831 TaxID=3154805 RepID=UPI0033E2FACB